LFGAMLGKMGFINPDFQLVTRLDWAACGCPEIDGATTHAAEDEDAGHQGENHGLHDRPAIAGLTVRHHVG
jgi:hypothetical protein